VTFLAVPTAMPQKLLLAMGGICGLRPSHSYFAGTAQLPLEARMLGIYAGAMVTFLAFLLLGRVGARRLGSRITLGLLGLFFLSMVFDGVNSTLYEMELPYLYRPTNPLRLITGLLSGIAVASVLTWLLAVVAAPQRVAEARALVRSPAALNLPLAANWAFAAVVMQEPAWAYYPIAALSMGGVVSVLAGVALLCIVGIRRQDGKLTSWQQLIVPGMLSLLASFVFIGVSAVIRYL
jgi:uncharacterized membrane protein